MAKEVQKQLTEIGNKAGFHMLKLISQKPEVIEDIPVTYCAAEVYLEKKEFPITKALGVVRIVQEDKLSFVFILQLEELPLQKWNELKKTASI